MSGTPKFQPILASLGGLCPINRVLFYCKKGDGREKLKYLIDLESTRVIKNNYRFLLSIDRDTVVEFLILSESMDHG